MAIIDRSWDEPIVFEAWGTTEHGASMISTSENAIALWKLSEEEGIPLFSIKSNSWNEVMTIYHEINGWEPYKPMEE